MSGTGLCIQRLRAGGLITNYHCTSQCGHCLYRSGPWRNKKYIDEETARRCFERIQALGCRQLHIGGGEPFLDFDGLVRALRVANEFAVTVEYVETNSSWYHSEEQAVHLLKQLKDAGLDTLLVSMSPFHNEHIPFYKVKGVAEACRKAGLVVFPWIREFYSEINSFDDNSTHSLSEYERRYGEIYLSDLPSRYWVHMGGRAVQTYGRLWPKSGFEEILNRDSDPCIELSDVMHFHVDCYGKYIPGLCSGFAVALEDLGRPLDKSKYPLITLAFDKGIEGLFEYASVEYGYEPQRKFLNKCDLCNDIRDHLMRSEMNDWPELAPSDYYPSPDNVTTV